MTQALDIEVFCHKEPVVFDWTVLIENHCLDFAEINSLNCYSTAWTLSRGKPLIYQQIEHLIHCGFKKFLIALFHVDHIVKQQMQQLQMLYQGCIFKCIQVQDSWFFEADQSLSAQGAQYLQHYIQIFLRRNSATPSFVWVQKIQLSQLNPLDYLKSDPHHARPLVWIKPHNQQDSLGFWLDIRDFALRYKNLQHSVQPQEGQFITQSCFAQLNQDCQEIVLKSGDMDFYPEKSNEDGLVASRCFNEVSIDTKKGVVVKQSSAIKKLNQEIRFYQQLPVQLQIYFPRLIGTGQSHQKAWYSLEYYPYKSLSQYFVYYALPPEHWEHIFDGLLNIHQQFTHPQVLPQDMQGKTIDGIALKHFYVHKLDERLVQARQNPQLASILSAKKLYLNGKTLQGFNSLYPWLINRIEQISQNINFAFIHGDLCFSNILFESTSGVMRLIDPRGEFMGSVNLGDPRYDLAKLLHSVHGRYDFIINDLFLLEQQDNEFSLSIPQSSYLEQVEQILLAKIRVKTVYPLHDLILLESLLFLTMLPLHRDQPRRQMAFLLTGLKLLNDVYECLQPAASSCETVPEVLLHSINPAPITTISI